MDDTDRKLLVLIGANPRMHLRELSKRLGISRQAVNHRIRMLTELGVIKGSNASISVSYLNAVPVAVFGTSKISTIEKALDGLGKSELTRRVVVAGGNYIYVVGFLRDIRGLDGYVQFVKQAAEMPEPTVGIYCLEDGLSPNYYTDGGGERKRSYRELSPLDLRIIASLRDNARRPIADIANMVGASVKTVRRHLDAMICEGSLEWNTPMDLASGGDMLVVMHVTVGNGVSRRDFGKRLLSKRLFLDQYIRTHSNLPSLLIWVFWSDNITRIRRVLREVSEDEDVVSTMLNFAYLERIYPTWRDRLPEVTMHYSGKIRRHKAQLRHSRR